MKTGSLKEQFEGESVGSDIFTEAWDGANLTPVVSPKKKRSAVSPGGSSSCAKRARKTKHSDSPMAASQVSAALRRRFDAKSTPDRASIVLGGSSAAV